MIMQAYIAADPFFFQHKGGGGGGGGLSSSRNQKWVSDKDKNETNT